MGTRSGNAPKHNNWIKDDTGFEHAQQLAQQLIRHLGVAGARKTCIDNSWNGVLDIIDRTG